MSQRPLSASLSTRRDKTPTRPEDVKVIGPGRRIDPRRDPNTDIASPADGAGGR